jgi:2-C-methyl-D-erythritol 4-phosphate cytidylyltransferase
MIKDLGIIIAAAGSSSRFGSDDKLLEKLDGMPLFLHSVRNFYSLCPAGNMIVVVNPGKLEEFEYIARTYLPEYQLAFVAGAELRAESVRNGLAALAPQTKFVAIQDAARPWSSSGLLKKCLAAARLHGGAVPAKAVTDTLKRANEDGRIIDTVRRDNLWRVETPQVFNLEQLLDANKQVSDMDMEFTDDASIMEAAGYKAYIVCNQEKNMKITYRKDIINEGNDSAC